MTTFVEGQLVHVCHRDDAGHIVRTLGTIKSIRPESNDPYYCVGQAFGYWLNADPTAPLWVEPVNGPNPKWR